MRHHLFFLPVVLILFGTPATTQAVELPTEHEYQRVLRDYLATLTENDFAFELRDFTDPRATPAGETAGLPLSTDELFRHWVMLKDWIYSGIDLAALKLPASAFTLAAIEGQDAVRPPPARPAAYAHLYAWDYPGNPYRGLEAMRHRAFVCAAVDLVMLDQLHERGSARRTDYLGGTLIWLGYTHYFTRDALPPNVRQAYETGLKKMAQRMEQWGHTGAMTDMDLLGTVGLWHTARATGDEEIMRIAHDFSRPLFTNPRFFHPAGYFVDLGCFDASYNGISLCLAGWSALLSDWPFAKEALGRAYRLRAHLSLPDFDGRSLVGPSHMNSRCSGDPPRDQWGWTFRHLGAALSTDEALGFVPAVSREELSRAPATLAHVLNTQLKQAHAPQPKPWAEAHWSYTNYVWVIGAPGMFDRLEALRREDSPLLRLPFQRPGSFTENFADTFLVAKRRDMGVIVHTGPVGGEDSSWRRPLGFGGGTLSAFWTADTGPVILGRRRGIQGPTFDSYEGWAQWPVHAVTGVNIDGKTISSARTAAPKSSYHLTDQQTLVEVAGQIPLGGAGPDEATRLDYQRRFELSPTELTVTLSLHTAGRERVAQLYEVIPVYLGENYARRSESSPAVVIGFETAAGWSPATSDPTPGVTAVSIERGRGAVVIRIDAPRTVKLSPEDWLDGYQTQATCRNIMIDLGGDAPTVGDVWRADLAWTISPRR